MVSSEQWRLKKQLLLASAFAFIAGYTDVVTVVRWKGWSTMMTGNLIFFGRTALANDKHLPHGKWFYMLLIITFFLGSVAHRVAETKLPKRGASTLGFAFATLMFVVEVVSIVLPDEVYGGHYLLAGLTPMFGLVMAACGSGSVGVPTTLVTGHITTLASLGTKVCLEAPLTTGERHKAKLSALVVGCTLLGAGVGAAFSYLTVGPAEGLLLPVAPSLALLLFCHDHMARPRSLIKTFHRRVREHQAPKKGKVLASAKEAEAMAEASTMDSEMGMGGISTAASCSVDEECCGGGAIAAEDVDAAVATPGAALHLGCGAMCGDEPGDDDERLYAL